MCKQWILVVWMCSVSVLLLNGQNRIDTLSFDIAEVEDLVTSMEAIYKMDGRNNDLLHRTAEHAYGRMDEVQRPYDRAKILQYSAFPIFSKDRDEAIGRLSEAADLFEEMEDARHAGRAHYHLAYYYGRAGNFPAKKEHLLKSIAHYESMADDKDVFFWFNMHNALASTYKDLGLYARGLDYALKAKAIAEKHDNQKYVMRAMINLSSIYGDLSLDDLQYGTVEDRDEFKNLARDYIKQSYDLSVEVNDPRYICLTSFNLGLLYSEEDNYTESNRYMDECIKYARENDFTYDLFTALEIKGENFLEMGQLERAKSLLLEAYEVAQSGAPRNLKARAELLLAEIDIASGAYTSAIPKINKASEIAASTGVQRILQSSQHMLYETYKNLNNYKQALNHYENWVTIKDSLVTDRQLEDITILRKEYENAEQAREIAELKYTHYQQTQTYLNRLYMGSGLLLFLIGGMIIINLRNRNRIISEQQHATDLEQRLLRSQMNPHFTYNTLSSIQKYLLKEGEAQKGAYYLAKFAKLMRQILDQSRVSLISIREEINGLENYLTLQKLRYSNNFKYTISVDESIDTELNKIPPMMIQPIIENAIEHGKIYTLEDGIVAIDFRKEGDMIKVTINDNGIGLNTNSNNNPFKKPSLALNIIKERIQFLKNKYNKMVSFDIKGGQGVGTQVSFAFPELIN